MDAESFESALPPISVPAEATEQGDFAPNLSEQRYAVVQEPHVPPSRTVENLIVHEPRKEVSGHRGEILLLDGHDQCLPTCCGSGEEVVNGCENILKGCALRIYAVICDELVVFHRKPHVEYTDASSKLNRQGCLKSLTLRDWPAIERHPA